MKIRNGFVTNSSSTAYYATNISKEVKTIVDFAKENIHLLKEFNEGNDCVYTEEEFMKSAQVLADNTVVMFKPLKPGEKRLMCFGDEDGTSIGHVFDYELRYGSKTNNFLVEFHEYWR